MAELDELLVKISADISELQSEMKKATQVTKKATDEIAKSTKKAGDAGSGAFAKLGNSVSVAAGVLVASAIQKTLATIAEAARLAASDFLEFDRAIAEVNSILPENAKLTQSATNQFIRFAAQFGSTSQQQAKAFYDIVSSGFSDTNQALSILNTANKAAAAGVTDVNTAVKGLTSVLNVFGSDGVDAAAAADILFKTVQQGVTTFPQLASTLGNVTSIAKAAGLEFSELAGAVGFLTTKGISTAEAVTSLRGLLVGLAGPTDAAKKAAQELGVELGSQALEQNGFAETVKAVIDATGGQIDAIRKLIPEVNAAKAVAAIAAGDFSDFEDALNATARAGGAAAGAFAEVEKSASFQFDKLTASLRAIPQLFLNAKNQGIAQFLTALNESLPAAVSVTLKALAFVNATVDQTIRIFTFATRLVEQFGAALGGVGSVAATLFTDGVGAAVEQFKLVNDSLKETSKNVTGAFTEDTFLSGITQGLIEAADEAEKLNVAFENTAVAGSESLRGIASDANAAATELSAASEAAKAFAESLIQASPEEDRSQSLQLLQEQLEAEQITREEFAEARRALLEEQIMAERDLLEQAQQEQLISKEEFELAKTELERRENLERLKLKNKEKKDAQRLEEQRLAQSSEFFGNLSALASTGSKELGAIGKGAAIAQATIDTYAGANKAIAQGGVFGPALAASIIVKGLANVARIASTPLQSGIDSVPGVGTQDNFPAILAPGERVVPTKTNQDLTQFLRQQQEGGSTGQSVVVNMNIEGDFFESDDANIKLIERLQDTLKNTGMTLA